LAIDYRFNKSILLEEVEKQTSIKVIYINNGYYLTLEDNYGHISEIETDLDKRLSMIEISEYGGNILYDILTILVDTFKVKFITDDDLERACREQLSKEKTEKLYRVK
jgi:hypothetical protein